MTTSANEIAIAMRAPGADPTASSRQLRVLVAHPGRQHSHQLAMGLAEAGMLQQFVTGVPTHRRAGGLLLSRLLGPYVATYEIPLDPGLVRHQFVSPLVQKAVCQWLPRRYAASLAHRADGWFDRLVARRLAALRPDVVVAYENSALHSFWTARRVGAATVLDAASFHHARQDRYFEPVESPAAHRRVSRRKDEEIALADHVLTVSELARESYVEAKVPPERVHAMPLGVSLDQFTPRRWSPSNLERPVRFAFVGHIDERKGADVLADAMRMLIEAGVDVSLSLIGKRYLNIGVEGLRGVTYRGWLPHSQLAATLMEHDVLVLPSRHDSFGLVVLEAMACGLPAIVSDHVGAKEVVAPQLNGLVVGAGDAAALACSMRWFVDNKSKLPLMGQAARRTAEQYTWQAYRRRVVAFIEQVAASRRS